MGIHFKKLQLTEKVFRRISSPSHNRTAKKYAFRHTLCQMEKINSQRENIFVKAIIQSINRNMRLIPIGI